MNIKSLLFCLGLLGCVHTTHTMWLVTLASDACVVASLFSIAVKKTSIVDTVQSLNFLKPTQLITILSDADKIHKQISWLLPGSALVSVATRLDMMERGPIRGTLRAGTSIPFNLVLMLGTYALRIYIASDAAGARGNVLDWLHKKATGR